MSWKVGLTVIVAAALLGSGCSGKDQDARDTEQKTSAESSAVVDVEQARTLGRAASKRLGKRLNAELMGAIGENGPAHALTVCNVQGLALAESVGTELGVSVSRVGTRTRNPANAPDAIEKRILGAFHLNPSMEDTVLSVGGQADEGGEVYIYMSPIRIASPLCLNCHGMGEELAPGVSESLAELYPMDRAVGYSQGELRGAFVVRVEATR